MPRKVDIRAGEIVPKDDGPGFRLTPEERTALPQALKLKDQVDIDQLAREVAFIGQVYFSRRPQQETGPKPSQVNEALRQLAIARDVVPALQLLNHAAESALLDALWLYHDKSWLGLSGVDGAFDLIEGVKNRTLGNQETTAIMVLRGAILEYLEELKQTTCTKRHPSLTLAVDELLELYWQFTGKRPTHSTKLEDNLSMSLNSEAGGFVAHVVDMINARLEEAGEEKILDTTVFSHVRAGCERFRRKYPQ